MVLAEVISIYRRFTVGIYKVTHFTFAMHFSHKVNNFNYAVLATKLCTSKVCFYNSVSLIFYFSVIHRLKNQLIDLLIIYQIFVVGPDI